MKKRKDVYISLLVTSSLYVNCNITTIRNAKKQVNEYLLLAIITVTIYSKSIQRFMRYYFFLVPPVLPRVPFLAPAMPYPLCHKCH